MSNKTCYFLPPEYDYLLFLRAEHGEFLGYAMTPEEEKRIRKHTERQELADIFDFDGIEEEFGLRGRVFYLDNGNIYVLPEKEAERYNIKVAELIEHQKTVVDSLVSKILELRNGVGKTQ